MFIERLLFIPTKESYEFTRRLSSCHIGVSTSPLRRAIDVRSEWECGDGTQLMTEVANLFSEAENWLSFLTSNSLANASSCNNL